MSKNMNLYKAEMYGILAVMVILTILEKTLPAKSMTAAIYCDNEAAVKRTKTLMNKYKYL